MPGDAKTQLTWMDAKCEGFAFTPRAGKAVEINAVVSARRWCLMEEVDLRTGGGEFQEEFLDQSVSGVL